MRTGSYTKVLPVFSSQTSKFVCVCTTAHTHMLIRAIRYDQTAVYFRIVYRNVHISLYVLLYFKFFVHCMLSRNPYDQGKFLYVNLKKLSHNRLDTLLIPHVSAEAPFSLSTRREAKITAVSRIFFSFITGLIYQHCMLTLYLDFWTLSRSSISDI